jgi:hypothetical protein
MLTAKQKQTTLNFAGAIDKSKSPIKRKLGRPTKDEKDKKPKK